MKYNITILKTACALMLLTPALSMQAAGEDKATVSISSKVVDEKGNPIEDAAIYGAAGAKVTHTDANGAFTIKVPATSDLMVQAEGYATRTVFLSDGEAVTLQKTDYLFGENDLVKIPFATQYKGKSVNSITTIDAEEILKYDNVAEVLDLIASRVPGLLGSTNVRGIGDALVVIDGQPRDISMLNVEEIESISVLRDINAVAQYGTQAMNGVILVNTKRGEAGKREINVAVEQGFDIVKHTPSYLSSADYMTYYNQALANDGEKPKFSAEEIENYRSGSNPYLYPNQDYYSSDLVKSMRETTRAVAEFSGGSHSAQYYTQVGWDRTGSILAQGEAEVANRFNVRGNINFDITDYIESYIDAAVVFDVDNSGNGDYWDLASSLHPYYFSPLLPIDMVEDPELLSAAQLVNNKYILGGTSQYKDNIYGDMLLSGYKQDISRNVQFNGGVNFDLSQLLEGLSLKTNVNFDFNNAYRQYVRNDYAVYNPTWNAEGDKIVALDKIGEDKSTGTQSLSNGTFTRRIGFNAYLDYTRTFNDVHHISSQLLGYYNSFDMNYQLLTDKFAHAGLRVAYDYDNRYLVHFNSNLSNSTKLTGSNQLGFSPTLGLGWVLSNEDFWGDDNAVDYLKLKATGGILVSDINMASYLYRSSYSSGGSIKFGEGDYNGSITNMNRLSNPNLSYEKMKNATAGVEMALFNKSLVVEANGFYNRYADQVTQRTSYYPSLVSSLIPYENYNDYAYYGAEAALSWNKRVGEVDLAVGGNILYANSQVMTTDELYGYAYQNRTGKPVDAIFGLESAGLYQSDKEIADGVTPCFGAVVPGDVKYLNQNGDNRIDETDEVMIGNSQARLSYGLSVRASYKNFSLMVAGSGRSGYDYMQNSNYFWIDANEKYTEVVTGSWTEENAATATYPRLSSKKNENNYRESSYWLRDGKYFSLDRVQLTYAFPHSILRDGMFKGADVYLRATDLLYLSNDARLRQINVSGVPTYCQAAMGVKLKF